MEKAQKITKILLIIICLFLLISTIFVIQIFWQKSQQGLLKVIFLDVGQGDSIFIEAPNGFQTIIDAGPNSKVVRSLSKFIPFYDRKIDLLIATHSDSDHVAGFVDLFKRFQISNFGQNSVKDTDALNTEIKKMIDKEKIDLHFLKSGDKIILDEKENIYLEILWPPDNHQEKDNNDNSLIVRLIYKEVGVMLTGDASVEVEEKLVENSLVLRSNILKAGHHGSRTSTSDSFLVETDPGFVIISAGKDNRFGHPHQEVLDSIEKFDSQTAKKIKILETSVLGSIYFKSDGEKVWLEN